MFQGATGKNLVNRERALQEMKEPTDETESPQGRNKVRIKSFLRKG